MRRQSLIRIDNYDKHILEEMKESTGLAIPKLISIILLSFRDSNQYEKLIITSRRK